MQDRKSNVDKPVARIRPTGHRILILLDDVEKVNTTQSGIVVAVGSVKAKEQEAQVSATVIDMGPTCYNLKHMGEEAWCKIGDRITIAAYSGMRMHQGMNPRLRMINDEDVTGVLLDDEDSIAFLQSSIEEADERFNQIVEKSRNKQGVTGATQ